MNTFGSTTGSKKESTSLLVDLPVNWQTIPFSCPWGQYSRSSFPPSLPVCLSVCRSVAPLNLPHPSWWTDSLSHGLVKVSGPDELHTDLKDVSVFRMDVHVPSPPRAPESQVCTHSGICM